MSAAKTLPWSRAIEARAETLTRAGVARALGCSEALVRAWIAKTRKPTKSWRARAAAAFGARWDDRVAVAVAPTSSPISPPALPEQTARPSIVDGAMSARERQVEIVRRIEAELAACGASTPANHKAALYSALGTANDRLAKLDGEGELTTSAILRSRAWLEVASALQRVLRKYPGAAEDLDAEIGSLSQRKETVDA